MKFIRLLVISWASQPLVFYSSAMYDFYVEIDSDCRHTHTHIKPKAELPAVRVKVGKNIHAHKFNSKLCLPFNEFSDM